MRPFLLTTLCDSSRIYGHSYSGVGCTRDRYKYEHQSMLQPARALNQPVNGDDVAAGLNAMDVESSICACTDRGFSFNQSHLLLDTA
jgi:hypothetical protein